MNIKEMENLRKQQKLASGLFLLTGFMGTMKAIGWFGAGTFPWYTEFVLAGFLLCYWVFLTFKIKKIVSGAKKDDTHA
jgi:hypothetical protein